MRSINNLPPHITIALIVLAGFVLAACTRPLLTPPPLPSESPALRFDTTPVPEKLGENAEEPIAYITQVDGDVFIEEASVGRPPGLALLQRPSRKASALQPLHSGSVLRAVGAAKAAIVYIGDRYLKISGGSVNVQQGFNSATPLPSGSAAKVAPGVGNADRHPKGRPVWEEGPRDKKDDYGYIPVVILPRNTDLLTGTPTVQWTEVDGAVEYRIKYGNPNGSFEKVVDSENVTCADSERTSPDRLCAWPWSWPGQSLAVGKDYFLSIGAKRRITDDQVWRESADSRIVLQSAESVAQLKEDASAIHAMDLDDFTENLLLAGMYAEHRMYDEAIVAYERALKVQPSAIIYVTLGDLYRKVELNRWALDAYQTALAQLEIEGDDPAVRAAAEFGLGEYYFGYEDDFAQAEAHYAEAARLFEQIGAEAELAAARQGVEEANKRQ